MNEHFSMRESIETGAPDIKYNRGDIRMGREEDMQGKQIAAEIWSQMEPEQKAQFPSFDAFYQSGIWKQILQQMQADQGQGQQGIGSLGPNQGSPSIMERATTDTEVEDAYGIPVGEGIESLRGGI